MASYLKRSAYLLPGAAIAATALHINRSSGEEKNQQQFVPRSFSSPIGSVAHGVTPVYRWDPNWDRRNPHDLLEERGIKESDEKYESELEKCRPRATRNLFLIRHGQYNLKGMKDEERSLTALGRAQAEYTGNRLKELDFPYGVLHRSTMTRAQETADIILGCFKENPIKDVKDCNLLEEGAPVPPDPPVRHWRPEVHLLCKLCSDCVTNKQFFQDGARIEAAFRKYFHRADASQEEDSYEIIVCHSNVIRYFLCRALQLPPDAWLRFTIHHCSISWCTIAPSGRVIVRCIGDSGHIPTNAVTIS